MEFKILKRQIKRGARPIHGLWVHSCAAVILFFTLLPGLGLAGQRTHTVYFEGQENELHVYRVIGARKGKTLLIIGGIQGDEPGGFLAADFYADFALETGNLIVVPRANFPSILKNERQINQDMNRKFMDDHTANYEAKVVNVLKGLICESDCFLNLHEGSGIFSPTWEDKDRNPKKYGQSLIADDALLNPGDGKKPVNLEIMAQKVIEKINMNINNESYLFHFNNHRTSHPDSLHKEQRRSATYYAHNVCKIPAFGVESAKSLPLEQKVRQHIYAINGFMEVLGIIPETPGIDLKKPEMQYMIISVNDSIPVVVAKMQHLKIQQGDRVLVHDIVANYERGLSVDVLGVGNEFNDLKKKLKIVESTRIEAKKDSYACGSVFLDVAEGEAASVPDRGPVKLAVEESRKEKTILYKLKINGETIIADNYSHVAVNYGDKLVIEDIITGQIDPSEYVVNFKGFVGNKSKNNGEDRGYVIDTAAGVLMQGYSLEKQGRRYHILTTFKGKEVGRVYIDIQS
ncbi:M14/M99 family metallopeptidase [Desulfospira joergensenii]|uniref:M14/M99 family metallopeptidase n=1 Tax=Desulfospira joergensenii TaxID=53329 RepID=UPI0003B3D35A|nr:M14/M99 family metallopeptidase [Desulfospira joergensenii]